MSVFYKVAKKIIMLFSKPSHPFNLNNDGVKTYALWQFERGDDTLSSYKGFAKINEMFEDKVVLDIGCGAAGKTIYYSKLGVKKIYGLEILEKYRVEADALAKEKSSQDKFEFVAGDGASTQFESEMFDTIIMNDVVEHVDDPNALFAECHRILKSGGRIYLNFPPYYHPYGSHLSDAIGMPWVQCFFSDRFLIKLYKDLVKGLPDGKERIAFRISTDLNGKEYFSYINKITIRKFNLLAIKDKYKMLYYKERPIRKVVAPFAKLPLIKEMFVGMVIVVLEK